MSTDKAPECRGGGGMEGLAKCSFFGTSLLMLWIGSRLLRVWLRTRAVPELSIGLGYALGTLGLVGLVVSSELSRAGHESYLFWLAAQGLVLSSQAALLLGVWWIFRPTVIWASIIALTGLLLCSAGLVSGILRGSPERFVDLSPHNILTTLSSFYTFAWLTFESFRYARLLKRRQSIGLADALDTWRFFCWGIAGITTGAVAPLSLFSAATYHVGLAQVTWIFLLVQLLLIVSSISTWLAFFPPAFYRRWVHGGEEPASA